MMFRFSPWFIAFILFASINNSFCAYFDYTDFDDPFVYLWNAKNQVSRDTNSPCSARVGNLALEGVCKNYPECQSSGGIFGGPCGLLSTCCVYMGGCNSKLSAKTSYFKGVPGPYQQSCIYQVKMHNRNICQLRLDFLTMHLSPPAVDEPHKGSCRDERFLVEGHQEIPQICGENSGQHMYLTVNGNDTTPIKLRIDLAPDSLTKQGWTIKITQLECPGTSIFPYRTQITALARDFQSLAPANCLQYFTDLKGSFKSFGYDSADPKASTYNVNQSYAVCFKRHNGVCGISYYADYFKLGADNSSQTSEQEYLYVPALQLSDSLTDERIQGQLNGTKYFTSVTPGPLYVYFKSDSNKEEDEMGFSVRYQLLTKCAQ